MAGKKSTERVLKFGDETAGETSTALTTRNSSRRDVTKSRQVSLKELAAILDRDRNTISKWLDAGLPFVEKAEVSIGKPWIFDTAEVVRWLENRAAETTAEKLGASIDGKMSEAEAKRLRAVSNAIIDGIAAAEDIKTVVRISYVRERVSADYAEIRSHLSALPDAISSRVVSKDAPKVKEIAEEQVRNMLKSLRADKEFQQADG